MTRFKLEERTGETDQWVSNTSSYAFEINSRMMERKGVVVDIIKRFYAANNMVNFYAIDGIEPEGLTLSLSQIGLNPGIFG